MVGRERKKRKIFPFELEEGQIVARVGRDDSADWKKTPIFRFGDDGVSLGDDVLIGNQETLSRNQEASAGGDRFSVLVLQNQKVNGRPGFFGQGSKIRGVILGPDCGSGEKEDKKGRAHPFELIGFFLGGESLSGIAGGGDGEA